MANHGENVSVGGENITIGGDKVKNCEKNFTSGDGNSTHCDENG